MKNKFLIRFTLYTYVIFFLLIYLSFNLRDENVELKKYLKISNSLHRSYLFVYT